MRIVYLVPAPLSRVEGGPAEMRQRERTLREHVSPGVRIDIQDVPHGPVSLETAYEGQLSLAPTAEALRRAEEDGYDAAILGCFGDPGLDALREISTRTAVVGPGEACCHMASMLGLHFGIITTSSLFLGPAERMVDALSLGRRCVGIDVVGLSPRELAAEPERGRDAVAAVADRLVERGADTLVLGCMTMGFLGPWDWLETTVGVPIVNPVPTAARVAEAVVGAGLKHSKRAYPTPTGRVLPSG